MPGCSARSRSHSVQCAHRATGRCQLRATVTRLPSCARSSGTGLAGRTCA
ncbi:hypothetical protein TPAR_08031 [Tolypocladium paradoxum]|uniref:Uncharacterized protein n=1 Tax=Tolypocladium paradoxum TaxID=94208 RepID=A0A2S4KNL7_9HYPO|nr:hypothetical protein TPAR_08031 [Tolypocladium paradoxum]